MNKGGFVINEEFILTAGHVIKKNSIYLLNCI